MLAKPWQDFDPERAYEISPVTGVYELGDAAGETVYIGVAGAREAFGIRGRIERHFSPAEPNAVVRARAQRYRYEVNMQYLTRYVELLTRYRDAHGRLPAGNEQPGERLPRLGRFVRANGMGNTTAH